MILKKILCYIFLFLMVNAFSQAKKIDSVNNLREILKTPLSDSLKFVTLVNLAQQYYALKEYDSVIHIINTANGLKKISNPKDGIRGYTYAGVAHHYLGSYDKSIEAHLSALKISDKYDENPAQIYNNIAMTYINIKNWKLAEYYLNKALIICKEQNLKRGLSYIYGNLGIVYRNQDKYEEALNVFDKSLQINIELEDHEAAARNYNNLGDLYANLKDGNTALNYYEKGLKISQKINYRQSIASINIGLGTVFSEMQHHEKAVDAFEEGLRLANDLKDVRLLKDGYLGLAEIEERNGQFQKSIMNRKLYEQWKDSLVSENHLNEIGKLEITYETEKKDRAIAEQLLQLKQQENKLQKKQAQYSIMTGIAIILLITSLMGWFLYQQRQKRKNQEILTLKREQQVKTLESLMQGEEQERLRIARELHDGVNGDLSAIKFKLTAMVEHNTTVVNEVVEMLDRSSEQVRAISHNLVPPALEKFNLVEALEDYATTMNDIHGPEISFQFLGEPINLSKTNEVNLYRIVQELVNNAIKHATANEITIQISHRDNNIQVIVEDNGKGFDPKTIQGTGIGLSNIQSRIDYLRGQMDVVSNKSGTSYTIEIDISRLNDD